MSYLTSTLTLALNPSGKMLGWLVISVYIFVFETAINAELKSSKLGKLDAVSDDQNS